MTRDIRVFIKEMGDDAAGYFGVQPSTIKRWLAHGNIPLNKASKAFEAMAKEIETNTVPVAPNPFRQGDPELEVDPAVMEEQAIPDATTRPKPVAQAIKEGLIEVDPKEQSAGSFVRPGRIPIRRAAPTVLQPRSSPAPVIPRAARPDGMTVDVYSPEQYAEAMRHVKVIGNRNWAEPHKPKKK